MNNFISELAALKFTPWYRWYPEVALRYLPVVEKIKNLKRSDLFVRKGQTLTLLEVGSGGLGIAPYLKQLITGLDIKFEPPFHPLLKRVTGDMTKLKLKDNSFDVVVSMDTLEHLSKDKRGKAISEMLRVAKKMAVIGVPCGSEAKKQDKQLREKYIKNRKEKFGFFEDHQKYGLPEETDILHYIELAARNSGKKIKIEKKGNENLELRKFLMKGWMSRSWLTNIVYRKLFLFLIPVFRMMDKPPYYRKIFFVKI